MSDTYQMWWDTEGSAMRPHKHEDLEEFARRITEIAWSNGRFVEKEACALVCERKIDAPAGTYQILMAAAKEIRRGE